MFRVLIAEDEPLIARAVKKMIESSNPTFQVIQTVLNGSAALEAIRKLEPDIVFLDIKMPVMDGLELLKKINEEGLQALCVILSGYQDFDYARKALRLGAFDYLLKPLSEEILKDILEHLSKTLMSRKRKSDKVLLETILFHKNISEVTDVKINGAYILLLINVASVFGEISNRDDEIWKYWSDIRLEEMLYSKEQDGAVWILDGKKVNQKVIICKSESTSLAIQKNKLKKIYDRLEKNGLPVTAVVTDDTADSAARMRETYHEMERALRRNSIFSNHRYIELGIVMEQQQSVFPDREMKNLLGLFARNEQKDNFIRYFERILTTLEKKQIPQILLEKFLIEIVEIIRQELGGLPLQMFADYYLEVESILSDCWNYPELKKAMVSLINEIFQNSSQEAYMEEDIAKKILQAEEYVKKHFMEQISVQMLADKFRMSQSKFSVKFKNEKGFAIGEFITKTKMEKAKELLELSPPLLIKDIAESVGYEDQFYFSRVFKAVYGVNPSKYRDTLC